jgi:hypothetical protein
VLAKKGRDVDKSAEMARRRLVEEEYGRQVDDLTWGFAADEDSPLNEVFRALGSRVRDHAWELSVVENLTAKSDAVADSLDVSVRVGFIREAMFGAVCPPFATLSEAWNWIKNELETPEAQREYLSRRVAAGFYLANSELLDTTKAALIRIEQRLTRHRPRQRQIACRRQKRQRTLLYWHRGRALTKRYNRLLDARSEIQERLNFSPLYRRFLKVTNQAPGSDFLSLFLVRFFYMQVDDTVDIESMRTHTELIDPKVPAGAIAYPLRNRLIPVPVENDVCVFSGTEQLLMLAANSLLLARQVPCWSQGECAAFILTGRVPQLPRWRIWHTDLPGGSKQIFIELNEPLTSSDTKEIHRIIREDTGTYRKRRLTPGDRDFLNFIERSEGMTWKERLERWNREHPDGPIYADSDCLSVRYSRLNKRRGQTPKTEER